jgi:hypothetical protein
MSDDMKQAVDTADPKPDGSEADDTPSSVGDWRKIEVVDGEGKKKAQAANDSSAATNGGSQSYNLTIAATAQNSTGVGSTNYSNQTASLSILLKFQEAA